MALTDAQITDVRRFSGYQLAGTTQQLSANNDITYLVFGMRQMSLLERLQNLSASEESVLVNTYLTNLYTLETAILGASANLDTDQAAVWVHNKNEINDRTKLFDLWCRKMCAFLGFAAGPGIGSSSSISLMRA